MHLEDASRFEAPDDVRHPEFASIWERVKPYTMTSPERGFALWSAVNHVVDCDLPGAFVECGVWRGGSSMLVALTLLARNAANRPIFMFDTFDGMTEPGPLDVDMNNVPAASLMAGSHGNDVAQLVQARATLNSVREVMETTGYDMRLIRLVQGDVRETLTKTQTLRIAILRLDTDFYDSTLVELETLYPRLAPGGILIVDDFGHWRGARKAVEDYFASSDTRFARPMFWSIDYTGRGAIKVESFDAVEIERYDYVSPNFDTPDLSALFPYAKPGNPWAVQWPYLRKEVPHIWRSDTRHTGYVTGNASYEEAAFLYLLARQFAGKRGLEIGTHFGYTAAHLLVAGLELDCIDPALAEPDRRDAIIEVLDAIETTGSYKLWPAPSPSAVRKVYESAKGPWSFAFIDGDHDGPAPANDAREVLKHLAEDALVVFHDLTSPFVEQGLAVFGEAGFSTRLINTMQILGVAWRGRVTLPEHIPDPNVPPIYAPHLAKYL